MALKIVLQNSGGKVEHVSIVLEVKGKVWTGIVIFKLISMYWLTLH